MALSNIPSARSRCDNRWNTNRHCWTYTILRIFILTFLLWCCYCDIVIVTLLWRCYCDVGILVLLLWCRYCDVVIVMWWCCYWDVVIVMLSCRWSMRRALVSWRWRRREREAKSWWVPQQKMSHKI